MTYEEVKTPVGSYFRYKCTGKKRGTIIFVHGFATDSTYHDVFIKHIIDEFDYIAIQLPGSGFQEWSLNKKPEVQDMVDYCEKLINHINLEKFILIGHSMGGGIAIRLGNIFKDKIICLIASTPMNSRISFLKIFNYFKFNTKTFKRTFKFQNILYYDLMKTFNNDQDAIQNMIKNELDYQLKHRNFFIKLKKSMFSIKNIKLGRQAEINLSCPTLVIVGKYDKLIPPKSLYKAFDKHKNNNIKIELMNKSAHIPFQEQEYEYAKEIKDFINLNLK